MKVLLCPMSDAGYLYPAVAVGLEMQRRGNIVSVLGRASAASVAEHAGLPFLAAEDYGGKGGFSVVRWTVDGLAQFRATLRAAPQVRADVLVTSVLCHGVLLAAELLDLPVIVLGLSAYLWAYRSSGYDEPQPVGSPRQWRTSETLRFYDELREQAGLPARGQLELEDRLLGAALLLRGDPALEHPGAVLPDRVQHVGPCAWEPRANRADLDAITSHLDKVGKPVVYVHLGLPYGGANPWPRLNDAFTGGDFQAVVEQGRTRDPQPAPEADILLVRKPWLGPLIDRAGLVLTHGTSAPVLAALLRGRPLGVSPAGSEQPMLAQACIRAGVAVPVPDVSRSHSALLRSTWHDQRLRARADDLGRRLASHGGASRAADVIDQAAGVPATQIT